MVPLTLRFKYFFFQRSRKVPPLERNQPENVGAIFWERLLYQYLKKSVIAFRKVEDDPALKNSHLKRTAFAQYFSLVNDMQQYEKDNFNTFQAEATFVVNNCLNRHILKLEFSEDLTEAYVPRKKRATSPSAVSFFAHRFFFFFNCV